VLRAGPEGAMFWGDVVYDLMIWCDHHLNMVVCTLQAYKEQFPSVEGDDAGVRTTAQPRRAAPRPAPPVLAGAGGDARGAGTAAPQPAAAALQLLPGQAGAQAQRTAAAAQPGREPPLDDDEECEHGGVRLTQEEYEAAQHLRAVVQPPAPQATREPTGRAAAAARSPGRSREQRRRHPWRP
jgi:hypothetical protein